MDGRIKAAEIAGRIGFYARDFTNGRTRLDIFQNISGWIQDGMREFGNVSECPRENLYSNFLSFTQICSCMDLNQGVVGWTCMGYFLYCRTEWSKVAADEIVFGALVDKTRESW